MIRGEHPQCIAKGHRAAAVALQIHQVGVITLLGVIHQLFGRRGLKPRGGAGDFGDLQQFLNAGGHQFPSWWVGLVYAW